MSITTNTNLITLAVFQIALGVFIHDAKLQTVANTVHEKHGQTVVVDTKHSNKPIHKEMHTHNESTTVLSETYQSGRSNASRSGKSRQ